jgi:peptidyl-prolyl cis-trans isomerase SurA
MVSPFTNLPFAGTPLGPYQRGLAISLIVAVLAMFAAPGPAPALAQDVQRIAAIVNDKVISRYDVEQRIRLVIATSRLQNSTQTRRRLRQQVLRGLIDESLQLEAAKRHSIRVNKADVERAFRFLEQQNKVPVGGLDRYMQQAGIPKPALEVQLRAQLSWTKLVRRRLSRNVQIGDEEIDEALARLEANAGRSEQRISEIFLPIDAPEQVEEVRRASIGLLRQLRDGASFAALARQFSRGATAAQGGAVGWVQPGQLATALDQAIGKLELDGISEPIEAAGGYYLIQLHERRKIAAAAQSGMKLALKQIVLSLAKDAKEADYEARETLARTVAESTKGCKNVDGAATEIEAASAGDLGSVKLTDLPGNIAAAVRDLAVGRFSQPIRGEGSVMLLMVCKRDEIKGQGPSRESITENLTRQRLAMLAQRYLRDLRRSAVVELR